MKRPSVHKNSCLKWDIENSFTLEEPQLTPEDYLELAELCKYYAQLRQKAYDDIAAEEEGLEEYHRPTLAEYVA